MFGTTVRRRVRRIGVGLVFGLLGSVVLPASLAAASPAEYEGTLPNGALWRAVVPDNWNGTLLLYSHGYAPSFAPIPLTAAIAPDENTEAALLDRGYALAGSSYAANGWALTTAVDDQLDSLGEVVAAIGVEPTHVLAYGSSMGGLVTARLAQTAGDVIEGALPTCGLMAGGVDLNNHQIDADHAIDTLLAPGIDIKYEGFANFGEAIAATGALTAAVDAGQQTPEGRARVALAAALHHMPDWLPGAEEPAKNDHDARQAAMYEWLSQTIGFVVPGRWDLQMAAGGNATWNVGVDYRQLLRQSADRKTVEASYREAGLDLNADLDLLTATADITADPGSVEAMNAHSSISGDLQMPVLSIHTTDDQLAPEQFEEEYAEDVRESGDSRLFRQAFVARPGHCAFTAAEIVAGVMVLEQRVVTGHWDGRSSSARHLDQLAEGLGLDGAEFVQYAPGEFLGDRDPAGGGGHGNNHGRGRHR
jgi:pimeloyl-ACP methyl ester carboxylesterase